MPDITIAFETIRAEARAELGRLSFDNIVLRAQLAELKAALPNLEPLPASHPVDEITGHKRPGQLREINGEAG